MRRYSALTICLLILCPLAYADTNSIIDQILTEDQITYADAAWLACNAAELVPDSASPADALAVAKNQGWKVPDAPESSPVTMGDYSYMLMSALKLKGGIMYSLAQGTRYALRELLYLKVVHSPAWPTQTVSGEEAMRILTKATDLKEKQR